MKMKDLKFDHHEHVVHPAPEPMHMEDSQQKRTKCTSYWRQFLLSLDISGLKDIADEGTRLFLRIIWAIILVCSLIVSVYSSAQNIIDYYDNPILTTYELITGSPIDFPDIYICPTNYINQTYVVHNGVDLHWAKYFRLNLDDLNQTGNLSDRTMLSFKQNLWDTITAGYTPPVGRGCVEGDNVTCPPSPPPPIPIDSFQEYFLEIGYQTAAFIKECSFMGQGFNCSDRVEEIFDRSYGKCFLFNMKKSNGHKFAQAQSGIGLSLALDIHKFDYPTEMPDPPLFDGVYMFISYVHDGIPVSPLLLSPGSYYTIDLKPTQMHSISGKFQGVEKRCIESLMDSAENTIDFEVLQPSLYSEEACRMECFQKVAVKKCNCVLALDEKYLNGTLLDDIVERKKLASGPDVVTAFCLPKDTTECIAPNIVDDAAPFRQKISGCLSECHPACSTWQYEPTLSRLDFPSTTLSWMTDFYDYHKHNTIMIDMAFPTLKYTKITQSISMTVGTFLSNIGGTLGLYLGVSILTGFQLIVACISLCCGGRNDNPT